MNAEPPQNTFMMTIISFLLGGLSSFIATLVAERYKRPHLIFDVLEPNDVDYSKGPPRPAKTARFLHIQITNRRPPFVLRWLGRNAAMFCSGQIDFRKPSGEAVFPRSMPLRWSGTPEPVPMQIKFGNVTGEIVDHFRYFQEQKVDIPAGESRKFDVAAQFDGEPECYGWSNESYSFVPRWRNPDRKLDPGTYRVEVTIMHAGGKFLLACNLVNRGGKAYLQKNTELDG
jgi:hypothetical protein